MKLLGYSLPLLEHKLLSVSQIWYENPPSADAAC
jgi:hypothetical protein